jgi:hypothetical protein
MRKNNAAVYWVIIGLLLLTIVGLVFKFVVLGTTEVAEDGRQAVVLDPSERALVLNEMRQFLSAVQVVLEAADRGDTAAIVKATRPLGMVATQEVPATLAAKLPLEFKTLGHGVHADFDRIAMDAEALADARHSLQQMNEVMKKCVACHAMYQITVVPVPAK